MQWLQNTVGEKASMLTHPLFGHRPGCPMESRSLYPPPHSEALRLPQQNRPHFSAKLTPLILGPEEQAVRSNLALQAGSEINQDLNGV